MKKYLAATKDGKDIYLGDKFISHMEAHPNININIIKEAINKIILGNRSFLIQSIDFHRIIGKTKLVKINSNDNVIMKYRKNRAGKSPLIIGHDEEDTSIVNIGLYLHNDNKYYIFTAFYGPKAPKEPWDPHIISEKEKHESEEFWNNHAFAVKPHDISIDWDRED